MKDALIPVRKTDIAIGKPLPWAVYDAQHVLLLNKGVVVTSEHQLEVLIEKGLYREGRTSALDALRPQRADTAQDQPLEGGVDMPFERLHLTPGDLVQLQPLQDGVDERYNVRIIGMSKGKSVLVSHPVVDEKVIFVREGQTYLVRTFSGVNACGFKARVLKANLTPYPYLHLSYPTTVHVVRVRQALRAPVDIIVAIYEREGGTLVASGRIVDLSVGGARVHSPVRFGKKGEQVYITFKVKYDDIEEIVTTPALVRSYGEETDEKGRPMHVVGLQFGEINPTQRLIIMNLVYQHLFKEY